jgi:hypothetical protein
MSFKLNNSDNYEPITVFLSKEKNPIAFENKVQCYMISGMSREEAEKETERIFSLGMELEVYYEVGYGLFAVEPEAVEAGTVFSPYSKEEGESEDDEM